MSKKLGAAIILGIAIVAGLIIFFFNRKNLEQVHPHRGEIVEAIYALGKVKAQREFELKIGVFSTVEKVFVHEGDQVAKGAPLAKFSESGIFKAPFAGVVSLVSIDEGESAAPSIPLLKIDDVSEKYVEASIEQQGALRVQRGLKAEVLFETLRGEKFHGYVSSLYAKNDEFIATIQVEGLRDNILPGMTADIAIIVGKHQNALLVPVKALVNGHLFILRKNKRIKIPVQVGAIDGEMAEILGNDILESDTVLMENAR